MRKLLTLLLISAFIFACSKDDAIEEVQQDTDSLDVTLNRNVEAESSVEILDFASFDELENFIRELQDSDTDLLDEAINRSAETGYQSLLYIYDADLASLDEKGIDMEKVPVVHSYDDMLHLLLNQNGEVKVANQIYRIDGEFVFQYDQGADDQISSFLDSYNAGEVRLEKGQSEQISEELLVYRHNNNEDITGDLDKEVEATENQKGITAYDYFSGGQYRMRSRQFNGFWLFYSNVGFSTKVQKRKRYWFFGWRYYWGTVKKYNRLNYNVVYTAHGTWAITYTAEAQGAKDCFCNIARKTIDWSAGVPVAPYYYSVDSGQSNHWAHEFSVTPNTVSRTFNY